MAQDVSGFGLVVNVKASATFPVGVTISQFADDTDPFDIPEITLADKGMGLNGDLVTWSKATPTDIKLSVISGSPDDINLGILAAANRVGRNKASARDVITLTAVYPSGVTLTLTAGKLLTAPAGSSVSSGGKLKSKVYGFTFENLIQSGF